MDTDGLIIIACLGIAGWIVAIWQYFRADETEQQRMIAEVEYSALIKQHHDLVRELAFPPYGYQPRDALGRYMRQQSDQERRGRVKRLLDEQEAHLEQALQILRAP